MARDQLEWQALIQRLLPSVVLLLRESRAAGAADPVADVRAIFWEPERKAAVMGARLHIEDGALSDSEWCALILAANLQL